MNNEKLITAIRGYAQSRADYESRGCHEPETIRSIELDMMEAEVELAEQLAGPNTDGLKLLARIKGWKS